MVKYIDILVINSLSLCCVYINLESCVKCMFYHLCIFLMVLLNVIITLITIVNTWNDLKVKVWLGGTTKNHLKEWLRNQNWSNNIPRSSLLNVFNVIEVFFPHLCIVCPNIRPWVFIGIKTWRIFRNFYS